MGTISRRWSRLPLGFRLFVVGVGIMIVSMILLVLAAARHWRSVQVGLFGLGVAGLFIAVVGVTLELIRNLKALFGPN